MQLHNPTLRVLNILNYIDSKNTPVSLNEISTDLALPKSTISPILKTLENKNYIKSINGMYEIGFGAFQLGLSYSGDLGTLSSIEKEMQNIVDEVEEICQLGVLVEDKILYLQKVRAKDAIEIVSSVGKKLPAYCTGLGKAILSGMSDEKIREIFKDTKFIKFSPNTKSNVDELLKEIELVRKNGFAMDEGEVTEKIVCIAIPIKIKGEIKTAISVTFAKFKDSKEKRVEILKVLLRKKALIEKIIEIHGFEIDWQI